MYYDAQPIVKGMWAEMTAQMSACHKCIREHHAAQQAWADTYDDPTQAQV